MLHATYNNLDLSIWESRMKYILNGQIDPSYTLKLFKGADDALQRVRVLNDDGTVEDTTGDTVTLELYTKTDRSSAVVKSQALTAVSATAGTMSFTPTIAGQNYGPGTYYAFLKHVTGAGVVTFSKNNYKIVIG